tara:strand:+ start:6954 stop:7166 length:213 start_codon:yes stop_codon:yes gene_type:complete
MIAKGWSFDHCNNAGVLAYSRFSDNVHGRSYVYYIQDICAICGEPHIKKRGSPQVSHNKCKMIPYRNKVV